MAEALREQVVLALDCQASGATPAHGDLLELGWGRAAPGSPPELASRWVVPRTDRPVPRPIRELTGWSEACVAEALDESLVWSQLCTAAQGHDAAPHPTVIHYARFELAFLRDLHERLAPGAPFPFDVVCLHAVARRLFPDLPRRNIRALAGYLGHSPELMRRSAGHVEATLFIWNAVLPQLEAAGVSTWNDLKDWLATSPVSKRSARRQYPIAPARRRALPDRPGVYRFLRLNGDVLYVGKAASLRKRVTSHFVGRGPTTERALELLTQAQDIEYVETASVLEAALLESDEIKRLDPPYNVQLRHGDRSAWFCARDYASAEPTPDAEHPIGPLPSRRALAPLAALIELAGGQPATPERTARALAVPKAFLPEGELFCQGWQVFAAEHLGGGEACSSRRVLAASRALWLRRGRSEPESPEDMPPDAWDLARVLRRLERGLVQCGLLVRRARSLCLLVDACVVFRERNMDHARWLRICDAHIVERGQLGVGAGVADLDPPRPRALSQRRSAFDAAAYDRLRVLITELNRVVDEGGEVVVCIGRHELSSARRPDLLRAI